MFGKLFKHKKNNLDDYAKMLRQMDEDDRTNLLRENTFIKNIACVTVRQFYDSDWKIDTIDGAVTITRADTDNMTDICSLLNNIKSINDIKTIDKKESIYYD